MSKKSCYVVTLYYAKNKQNKRMVAKNNKLVKYL